MVRSRLKPSVKAVRSSTPPMVCANRRTAAWKSRSAVLRLRPASPALRSKLTDRQKSGPLLFGAAPFLCLGQTIGFGALQAACAMCARVAHDLWLWPPGDCAPAPAMLLSAPKSAENRTRWSCCSRHRRSRCALPAISISRPILACWRARRAYITRRWTGAEFSMALPGTFVSTPAMPASRLSKPSAIRPVGLILRQPSSLATRSPSRSLPGSA